MRATFHPYLPNGLDGDPVVWVELPDDGLTLLLDLGDLRELTNRRLMRVDRVLVSHTHMDHFIGFDQLLRLTLHRERELTVTGPPGFLEHVAGRIGGYSWNLIESYPIRLIVEEVDGETIRSMLYTGGSRMRGEPLDERPFRGTIQAQRELVIHADLFDHGIPVLGFVLAETEHLAVNKDRVTRLGLEPGAWLRELKQQVRRCAPDDRQIVVPDPSGGERSFRVGELAEEILARTAGRRLGYLTDLRPTDANLERAMGLVRGVDLLICEATFLHCDAELAERRGHLTARQAGELAREAGVARLAPFHYSPRYAGREAELLAEAAEAFGGPVVELPKGTGG